MTSFVFTIGILFGFNFVSFPCEGQINLPPGGERLIVAPGDDVTIAWTFNNTSWIAYRFWTFRNSSQGSSREEIAWIIRNSEPDILNSSLPRVEIEKPATLILRNVDHRYDGKYGFDIIGSLLFHDPSYVRLFVAVQPTVTVCSSPVEVDEGGDVRCLCKGEGGNPPTNVTWYKNDVQIDTKYEENMLTLSNVDGTDGGTYKCVAQSYTFKDEESIELIVNLAPVVKSVLSFPPKAVLGESVTIMCEANARLSPSYTIIHNGTVTVSNEKMYTILPVNFSHAGSYQCIAKNKLGNSSKTYILNVTSTDSDESKPDSSNSFVVWRVVVFLLSGFIIGVLSCIVLTVYFRRRYRDKKLTQSNPAEQKTASKVDSIYQDLDLNKMNEDENYQSLQGATNSGNNDPERNYENVYTQLKLG